MPSRTHTRSAIVCFRRWTRKSYAVFCSLGSVIKICRLRTDLLKSADNKGQAGSSSAFPFASGYQDKDWNDPTSQSSLTETFLPCVCPGLSFPLLSFMTSSVTEPDRPLTGHKTNIVLSGRNNTDIINSCKEKVLSGNSLTPDEAMLLAESGDKSRLFAAACKIRRHFCGDEYELCSIINARSGRCAEDCKWCAQSAFHSTDIDEYELVEKNLAIKTAWNNEKLGIHKFSLVTSGKKATKNVLNDLCDMYREIKEKTGIELCASMGLLDKEELLMLKGAGVKNYHCNLETSRAIFGKLCSTHTYDDKINTIELAKEAGLTVCSGCIIGMGESMRDRINIAFELKNLGVNSVPVNVLHPVKGTPLEHISSPADEEILTTFAVFRFILPAAQIRLAGGRCRISHIMPEIIRAGVNAAITGNLLTTTGAGIIDDIRLFENEGFRRKI